MADNHIESLYQEARSALKSRDYDYAIELLKRVLVIDETYKDTSRLLEKAVRLRKLRWYKNPRLWGVFGLLVVFVLGFAIAPRIGGLFASPAPTETIIPTATRTAMPTKTSNPTTTPTRAARPTPTPTPNPMQAFESSIRTYINGHTPTFEDDFSSAKFGWGNDSENFAIFNRLENDSLIIQDCIQPNWGANPFGPDFKIPGISFPTNGLFDASDFALQFEFRFGTLMSVGLQFRSARTLDTGHRVTLYFSGAWDLKTSQNETLIAEGYQERSSDYDHVMLLAKGSNVYIYLNNKLLHEGDNFSPSRTSNRIIVFGNQSDSCASSGNFDNFKFWNLDGVNFNP